jgi:hypothetical protein
MQARAHTYWLNGSVSASRRPLGKKRDIPYVRV